MQTHALGNILRVVPVDLVNKTPAEFFDNAGDFVDEIGFFIRSGTSNQDGAGDIKYCPINNKSDAEAITKTVDTTVYFCDPEICRKIFASGTDAENIYVGYGI